MTVTSFGLQCHIVFIYLTDYSFDSDGDDRGGDEDDDSSHTRRTYSSISRGSSKQLQARGSDRQNGGPLRSDDGIVIID